MSSIFKSLLGLWNFVSFDKAKHIKSNGQWVYQSIDHENVQMEGLNPGSQMEFYNEYNPESVIVNSKNAKVELWFGIKSVFYCGGQPIEKTFISGQNSRMFFPITD